MDATIKLKLRILKIASDPLCSQMRAVNRREKVRASKVRTVCISIRNGNLWPAVVDFRTPRPKCVIYKEGAAPYFDKIL